VVTKRLRLAAGVLAALALAGCSSTSHASAAPVATDSASAATPSSEASASPSAKPSPTKKPSPTPTKTLKKTVSAGADVPKAAASKAPADSVPLSAAGTFSVASGGTGVVGTGATLVKYRVEVEDGIKWGSNPVWTPASFAATVDSVYANPRGWIKSSGSPVTVADQGMKNASWSFQRVSGTGYSARIRLATPDTVDKLCGAAGVQTQGQYSCRFGNTLMINLRRWLKGVPGFATDLLGYRNMVLNHEMGHFLGFDHMLCPGAGKPAPVMQTQTIALDGCKPNPYPFGADGTFIVGPLGPP
jgi:hypothetical protein